MRVLFAAAVLAVAAFPSLDSADAKHVAVYACNDGIDNDGDGLTDYPADTACIGPFDYSEVPQCSDGIDNDGNGVIDYPAEEACTSPTGDQESDIPIVVGGCNDGYDNDLDGKTDYPADPDCKSPGDFPEGHKVKAASAGDIRARSRP
jgi:hypothetical protein